MSGCSQAALPRPAQMLLFLLCRTRGSLARHRQCRCGAPRVRESYLVAVARRVHMCTAVISLSQSRLQILFSLAPARRCNPSASAAAKLPLCPTHAVISIASPRVSQHLLRLGPPRPADSELPWEQHCGVVLRVHTPAVCRATHTHALWHDEPAALLTSRARLRSQPRARGGRLSGGALVRTAAVLGDHPLGARVADLAHESRGIGVACA